MKIRTGNYESIRARALPRYFSDCSTAIAGFISRIPAAPAGPGATAAARWRGQRWPGGGPRAAREQPGWFRPPPPEAPTCRLRPLGPRGPRPATPRRPRAHLYPPHRGPLPALSPRCVRVWRGWPPGSARPGRCEVSKKTRRNWRFSIDSRLSFLILLFFE